MKNSSSSDFQTLQDKMHQFFVANLGQERAERIMNASETDEEYEARVARDNKEHTQQLRKRIAYENSGLEGKMLENTFSNIEQNFDLTDLAKAFALCKNFTKHWPNVKKGVFLYGDPGVGKSTLLHAIANELIIANTVPPKVVCVRAPDIPEIFRSEQSKRDDMKGTGINTRDTRSLMWNADVLCLCDITGVSPETMGPWMSVIGTLVDRIDRTGKPILCVSGNSLTINGKRYSAWDLIMRLGKPFHDRIEGNIFPLEITGRSHRTDEIPAFAKGI